MYIYNQFGRFLGGLPHLLFQHQQQQQQTKLGKGGITGGHKYKITRRKASNSIKTKPVGVTRPTTSSVVTGKRFKKKLKPLTKRNIEFLTELGYKVLKN